MGLPGAALRLRPPRALIVSMSLQPGIPRRVALQQSPPPLPRPRPVCNSSDESATIFQRTVLCLEFRRLSLGVHPRGFFDFHRDPYGRKPGRDGRAFVLIGCFPPVCRRRVVEDRFSTTASFSGGLQGPAARALGDFLVCGLRSGSRPHLPGRLLCPPIGYHRGPNVLRGAGLLAWSVDLPVDVPGGRPGGQPSGQGCPRHDCKTPAPSRRKELPLRPAPKRRLNKGTGR